MKRPSTRPTRKRKRPLLLKDEERYRLLYGPYEPPLVKRGFLVDAVRGKLPFGTFTNALIPWPKARRRGRGGSGGIILCGDLLRALAKESGPAISHHWGVSRATVSNWRRALELKGLTAGAQRLVGLGVELARLPQSRKKFSDAARGRVLSSDHKAKLFAGLREGWSNRFKARRAAYRRTGRFPKATPKDPWIPEEERLLAKLPTPALVRLLGRTTKSIQARRIALDIRLRAPMEQHPWKDWETKLLGTASDSAIARRLRRSPTSVQHKRRTLGVKPFSLNPWTEEQEALVGKLPDAEVARRIGRTRRAVVHRRLALGLAFFHTEKQPRWSVAEKALLGTDTDARIAQRLGRTPLGVANRRRALGLQPKTKVRPWTSQELTALGTRTDREVARQLHRTVLAVRSKRLALRIPPGTNRRWTPWEEELLGTASDAAIAVQLNRSARAVRLRRSRKGMAIWRP